ncbi:MAG: peptidoglycan DD-metalloendopeptidase family protein [Actinomycetota bacterium]
MLSGANMSNRKVIAYIFVAASVVVPLTAASSVETVSSRCTKAGANRITKGIGQVCTRVGKQLVWKTVTKTTTKAAPTTSITAPPTLTHAPIDNAGLNCDAGQPMVTDRYYCFSSFADKVFEGGTGKYKWLPHYTYRLRANAKIYASMDGTIQRVITQEPDDLEFWLTKEKIDDVWMLVYDHVATMRVAEGARVKAGDWIATSPNETTHRFEFQVNKDTRRIDNTSWHICPRTIGSSTFNSFHDSVLASNNARATDGGFTSVCMAETVDPQNLYLP